jgi:signal transduction histidine kinase
MSVPRGVRPLVAVAGLLTVAGLGALWVSPPAPARQWAVIWELLVGAGFATAGCTVLSAQTTSRDAPVAAGGVGGRRASAVGWALAGGALLLLAAASSTELGAARFGDLLALLAVTVVLPLTLLNIVPRRRALAVQRGLDSVVLVVGVGCVASAAVSAEVPVAVAGTTLAVAVVCAGWLQFELTSGDERRQVLWLILAAVVAALTGTFFLVLADGSPLSATAIGLVVAVLSLQLPLSAAVAVLAPRWMDVRAVISTAVLVAAMFVLTVAVYAGGEALLRLLLGHPPTLGARAVLATVIGAGFHPALVWVKTSMDELLFGGRSDPVDTLTRLGTELTAGTAPEEWLETLRSALAVPGIVLRHGDEVVASSGEVDYARCTVTPLRTGSGHVGDLVVGVPSDQLGLAAPTRGVLELVAAPLAQALYAVRLSGQLQASRGRVVAALEEERRRVRRDLHDGLGPTLTGIAYSADAARNLIGIDPDQAENILRDLRADAGEAIAEVRRIVYGMRPRALDELGLVEAVRQRVLHLQGLSVTLTAPQVLPALPAAVEVAAYRVALEAVTNVARHAGVDAARLEFAVSEGLLRITVADDGASREPWRPGVGLASMRDRVEQIGGTLVLISGPDGATVTADLPLEIPA